MTLHRRKTNYWEPIFDNTLTTEFIEGSWDFSNQKGPRQCIYKPEKDCDSTVIVEDITFSEVDFNGKFDYYRIIFKSCTFTKCDFAGSTFHRAKFTSCKFIESTFSLCTLNDCELRGCTFDRIGFSGNETIVDKTLITNPSDFISGGQTNITYLPPEITEYEQTQRFEITKSTIARSLMATLANEGSEQTYYDGIKISTVQDCRANVAINRLAFRNAWVSSKLSWYRRLWDAIPSVFGFIGSMIDLILLKIFGLINAWGASITRPVLIGLCLVLVFGCYYSVVEEIRFRDGLEKSTEILLLFGYTKHSVLNSTGDLQSWQFLNAIVGVIWYVVTIPTIVNKLTRVRG